MLVSSLISISQQICYRFATNLYVRVISLILIVIDICLVITELVLSNKNKDHADPTMTIISMVIVTYFVVEVCMRIHGYG